MFLRLVAYLVRALFLNVSTEHVSCLMHPTFVTSEVLHYLMKNNLIDGNPLTVTGKSLGENLDRWVAKYGELSERSQDIIRPLSNPLKPTGHIRFVSLLYRTLQSCAILIPIPFLCSILRGNLAPGGAVSKITGKEGLEFTGVARVFDGEEQFTAAVESGVFKKGEKAVAVLRYLGPKGGPGTLLG